MAKHKKDPWSPTAEDYRSVIAEQNPWALTGMVPAAWARDIERPLARRLWNRVRANKPRRFEVILGPRRVGKSTAMFQTVRHLLRDANIPRERIVWLRLDHPLLMRLDLGSLVRSLTTTATARSPCYLFLDELTYARDWDLWLKTFYDETWPVRIVASSSSTAALQDRKIGSRIGRWNEQYFPPCLFSEYLELIGQQIDVPVRDSLFDTLKACGRVKFKQAQLEKQRRRYLLTGGFPELLLNDARLTDESALLQSQQVLRTDAVQSAIYKDIPQAFGVDSPMLLERLLYTLAGQVAGILSPNSICQGLGGMSQPTFDRYLSYLEQAYLVFTLPNYSGAEASIQKRGRKLYFVDSAVRNAALQRGLGPLSNVTEMGHLVENMIAGHLYALGQQTQVRLFYWRDKNDEIDFVYDHPQQPLAVEIGSGRHSRGGLYKFMQRYPRFKGRCFMVSPQVPFRMPAEGVEDDIGTIPLDLFLLAVSTQAERELENRLQSHHRQA